MIKKNVAAYLGVALGGIGILKLGLLYQEYRYKKAYLEARGYKFEKAGIKDVFLLFNKAKLDIDESNFDYCDKPVEEMDSELIEHNIIVEVDIKENMIELLWDILQGYKIAKGYKSKLPSTDEIEQFIYASTELHMSTIKDLSRAVKYALYMYVSLAKKDDEDILSYEEVNNIINSYEQVESMD